MARTRWMFGFHRRLVRRWEWLMLMPNDGPLPHILQTAAIGTTHLVLSGPEWAGRDRTGALLAEYSG